MTVAGARSCRTHRGPNLRVAGAEVLVGLIALAVFPGPLSSQAVGRERLSLSGTVGFASRYLWRGLTRQTGPAGQLTAVAGWRFGGMTLEASASSTATTQGCPDAVESCPISRGLRVADLSAQLLVRVGVFSAGVSTFEARVPPWAPDQASGTTNELVANFASPPSNDLKFGLQARYDVKAVKGAYLEAWSTVPVRIPTASRPTFYLTASTGFSIGQEISASSRGYYAKNGFTHLLAELAVPVVDCASCLGARGTVQLFFQINGNLDDATRRRSPWDAREKDQRGVLGVVFRAASPGVR